jgi:hypothetical protein
VELYPELPIYRPDEPAPMTVRLKADDGPDAVSGTFKVRIDDGSWHDLPGRIPVPGGQTLDRLRGFDLRQATAEEGDLPTGTHLVRAGFFPEDGRDPTLSEPVEIFVEPSGDGGGGGDGPGDPPPEPEPPPEPPPPEEGSPPPPDPAQPPEEPQEPGGPEKPPDPRTVVVDPLFDEGETIRKTGPALVFDPDAPRGEPAEERSLEEAFPELRRRAEDAIARDEVPPRWRSLVERYFELIRPR